MQSKEKGYYDIDIDIDEALVKMGMVDDIFYLRDLKQRKLFLTANPRFGYVKLLKTERSETAAMADLLD